MLLSKDFENGKKDVQEILPTCVLDKTFIDCSFVVTERATTKAFVCQVELVLNSFRAYYYLLFSVF